MTSPGREIFWQVSNVSLFYVSAAAACLVCAAGILLALRFVRKGARVEEPPAERFGLRRAAAAVLDHGILSGPGGSRACHLMIFYGWLVLLLVTCWIMAAHYGPAFLFQGPAYLAVSLAAEAAGVSVLAGIGLAWLEGARPSVVGRAPSPGPSWGLLLLAAICLSGFLLEGARLRLQLDPWRAWSPVGAGASLLFLGLGDEAARRLFRILWWGHALLALGFIAWLPFSGRLRHVFFLAFSRAAAAESPRGLPPFLDLPALRKERGAAAAARLGLARGADATPRQRLGMLSCVECGRCELLCPAHQCGQPLSPRAFLQGLRREVPRASSVPLAEEAVTLPALWACRLCLACSESCPAGVDHVGLVAELRRAEVLGYGRIPPEAATALRQLRRTGNPFGASPGERSSWIRRERIPSSPGHEGDEPFLLWTGCFPPGDDQKPRILSALVALLRAFEVPFFTLDDPLACCGEPARVLGDEALFQETAERQIHRLGEAGVERVLVHCPHCYTVLKDHYPLLGARFTVVHTTVLFTRLLAEGRIPMQGLEESPSVVYHDPCFLGRYHGLYDPPREILASIPGLDLRDPLRRRGQAFCCGAGEGTSSWTSTKGAGLQRGALSS